MLEYKKFTLKNGLRVIVHQDRSTPMACVNVLYDVGARDENPDQTGFAHLFEHLMFGGSVNISNFDGALQRVGGENNAFTSNDITNYYISLPAVNIETALWLESDRMLSLDFNENTLSVEKQVVIEEFKQRYLNQPYGDSMMLLRDMSYQRHPYKWPTIGKEISHIETAKLEDVKKFFFKHYSPQNAILTISGNVDYDGVRELVEKWFSDIPAGHKYERELEQEPKQTSPRIKEVIKDVPFDALYIAFHGTSKFDESYYAMDLISDILSRGSSSRLFRSLVREKKLFSDISATVTGSIDPNLFIIEGKLVKGVSLKDAEAGIWEELKKIKVYAPEEKELQKVKNKVESTMLFSELSILDKAMNLAYFELLGDVEQYNQETANYAKVSRNDILKMANTLFQPENSNTLYYKSKAIHEDK